MLSKYLKGEDPRQVLEKRMRDEGRLPPEQSATIKFGHVNEKRYGYSTNIPLVDLDRDDVLLATRRNGDDLDAEHGGPLRLVVPHLYAWKSCKWIRGLIFMDEDKAGIRGIGMRTSSVLRSISILGRLRAHEPFAGSSIADSLSSSSSTRWKSFLDPRPRELTSCGPGPPRRR